MLVLDKIFDYVTKFEFRMAAKRWKESNGNDTYRIDYDLTEDSVVFDVGGYRGDWAWQIHEKFGCRIFIFEPVTAYYEKICQRFIDCPNIEVFKFGLGTEDTQLELSVLDDSSSFYKNEEGASTELCQMVDIENFISERNLHYVDLIKINIEGGEYELLDKILSSGLIERFNNLQIQFHTFIPRAYLKRKKIQGRLSRTHRLTYNYPFIWENWCHKNTGQEKVR